MVSQENIPLAQRIPAEESISNATEQFDRTGGIVDHMARTKNLGYLLEKEIHKIVLTDNRRMGERHGLTLVGFSLKEIEILAWMSAEISASAETLSAELDEARSRLIEAERSLSSSTEGNAA
ncbi:MAG TPA: hypothetical protein VNS12_10750 [Pelagibacterium sp.]|uniref:hypothetical protein n=1 Tax=Pelagibacterium sp. TaxID=1967288 RepID=UPI002C180500|nr:hypothetical protein [Pelagibacterium sp.]HWJ88540.1 hypothetical protein [Pelagibacterium sp.]